MHRRVPMPMHLLLGTATLPNGTMTSASSSTVSAVRLMVAASGGSVRDLLLLLVLTSRAVPMHPIVMLLVV